MKLNSRLYVAGHTGLVGSALVRKLQEEGYTHIITRAHAELDLTQKADVEAFFTKERPEYVFLAAAKVGGIWANKSYPVDFLLTNLKIQNNVIEAAWKHDVKGLLYFGSSCIYPRLAPQPLKEEYLLTGLLEPTNEPYAIAKIAGIELCEAYNRQYGSRFLGVMPTNLYGPNDNYDLQNSHVLPALIRKFHLAKLAAKGDWDGIQKDESLLGPIPDDIRVRLVAISRASGHENTVPAGYRSLFTDDQARPAVLLWGTGSPRREFLYSADLGDACIFLMNLEEEVFCSLLTSDRLPLINIGSGKDQTIRELAALVAEVVGFEGDIEWDLSKPDGTPQKLLDISKITHLGWTPRTSLEDGLRSTYEQYLQKPGPITDNE